MHIDRIAHRPILRWARARTLCLSPSHSAAMVIPTNGQPELPTKMVAVVSVSVCSNQSMPGARWLGNVERT